MPDGAQPPEPEQKGETSRAARARQRRADIVAAAQELFSYKGYRGTGLSEVAERVGLTLPGVLYHFPSKEVLLQAVITQRDDENTAVAHYLATLSGAEAAQALIETTRHNERHPELLRLFLVLVAENLEPSGPVHEHFRNRYRQMRLILAGALRQAVARGELGPGLDPDRAAVEVIAMMDGLAVQWLLDPGEVDLPGTFEHYLRALIAAHPPSAT